MRSGWGGLGCFSWGGEGMEGRRTFKERVRE